MRTYLQDSGRWRFPPF